VLQEKKVRPVGGDEELPVDFRLVCATHRNLGLEVREGRFREDLFYRLKVLELRLPPLRERPMDIPFLLREFLTEMAGPNLARAAMALVPASLLQYHFPGNVRELRNFAERYAALAEVGGTWDHILEGRAQLAGSLKEAIPEYPGAIRSSRLTRNDVLSALEACGYHRGKAAAKLGVTRRTLQYHLERMKREGERKIPKGGTRG